MEKCIHIQDFIQKVQKAIVETKVTLNDGPYDGFLQFSCRACGTVFNEAAEANRHGKAQLFSQVLLSKSNR